MTRSDILAAARDFLSLLSGELPREERERGLRRALDRLALAYHHAEAPLDAREYPDVRETGIERWNALCERLLSLFPDFGHYNVAADIIDNVGTGKLAAGDPIDDLADIALDLQEFIERWERNSEEDALECFRFGFESHWGRHLRALQVYLHERAFYRFEQ